MLRNKLKAMLMAQKNDELLPRGYKRVSYLESTGTQGINTGITIADIETIELRFSIVKRVAGSGNGIFGVNGIGSDFRLSVNAENTLRLYYGETVSLKTNITYPTDFMTLKIGKGLTVIDNEEIQYKAVANTAKHSLYLFNWGSGGDSGNYSAIKLDYVKINNGETADLVACLDDNGKPCMYDFVSKQTFYNVSKGEFNYAI